jgi:hypothetical protein
MSKAKGGQVLVLFRKGSQSVNDNGELGKEQVKSRSKKDEVRWETDERNIGQYSTDRCIYLCPHRCQ